MQVLFVLKSVTGVAARQILQPLEDGNHRLVGEPGNVVVKENDCRRKWPPSSLSDFGLRSENSIRLRQDFVGFAKYSTAI